MRTTHPQKYLSFLVPVVLGLSLACSDAPTTAPQKFIPPDATAILLVNDDQGDGSCSNVGDVPKAANGSTSDRDFNGNGIVCVDQAKGKKR
jgi:hypothetical protein